jgi:hypothetical protein
MTLKLPSHLTYLFKLSQVKKMSQRNYQENLSLLKNLHKLYYFTKENKDTSRDQPSRKTSSMLELKLESKNDAEKKKIAPKVPIQ